MIAKSSLVAFGPEFHARGLLHRRTVLWGVLSQTMFMRFGADEEKLEKIRESVLQITKGWDHLEVKKLVAETINEVIEPLIYEDALALIDHHLAQGDEVWLVSASPTEIVEPFAELLGITGAIASRATIDEFGKFTGEMAFFAQGENKAMAIRELAQKRDIDLNESFAYSDSETDIPMLESVGHAYAVNADRNLAKAAHENQWPILNFKRAVRAHDRSRSNIPYLLSAVVIGAAAVLGRTYQRR